MRKLFFIIAVFCLMVAGCRHSKDYSTPEEREAMEKWTELEDSFNNTSFSEKDSYLMEMFSLKMQWNYSRYLEPRFDSLVWAFLQDERTFYHEFISHPPKWFVSTSPDGKVRMYSYEQTGGTAKTGRTIYQYIDKLGHLQLKELTFDKPDDGGMITPIFKTIQRVDNGYMLYGGTITGSQDYHETNRLIHDTCFAEGLKDNMENESFTVVYRQPVNGYKVKAVAKLSPSDVDIISADLTFTKDGKSFTLHTQCFGDTVFSKGRLDYHEENPEIFRRLRFKTIEADYHEYKEKGSQMPMYTPFFFRDLDFDGVKELVIVHHSMGVRYHDGYDVYRIVEGEPFLINHHPYNDNVEDWGFGMTDYPEFDFNKKTISCPYPEGEIKYDGCSIYGVSKKQKDTVTVNGRKHLFNHMEVIKEIKYNHDE